MHEYALHKREKVLHDGTMEPMDHVTWVDILRLVNAVGASLVFCGLIYKGRIYFEKYTQQQKFIYISFTMYTLAAAYGSVEAYKQGVGFGWRLIILLLANATGLFAFIRYHRSAFEVHEDADKDEDGQARHDH